MGKGIIPLKREIIYGPVDSRRLGRSLGLNVLPPRSKFCSFDCVYCQYGHTRVHTLGSFEKESFPSVSEIEAVLVETLQEIPAPAYITLSGNGEPTLHPFLQDVVSMMRSVRDRLAPHARTAVLSNSTTVTDPEVREALQSLDVRIMKLDAGSAEVFNRFNVPCSGVDFERVVDGLVTLRDVTIQTLFAGGPEGNFTASNISQWIDCLERIKPVAVQVYSLDRGTPSDNITTVAFKDLETLVKRLGTLGFKARAYARESS